MGSVLFRLIVAIALRGGLDPNDLKLVTAGFVFLALVLPTLVEVAGRDAATAPGPTPGPCCTSDRSSRRSTARRRTKSARSAGSISPIDEGSFVVVIGTNGSGKSTLLNAVAGIPGRRGDADIDGVDVTTWPEHRRAALIGRVFQNPFSGTAPSMSIAENLALAARRGLPSRPGLGAQAATLLEFRERVRRLNMGLEERLENPSARCRAASVRHSRC